MVATDIQVLIHWAEEGKWLCFRNPIEVFFAGNPNEVVSILDHIEKEVETRKIYAAGFLAYEAGQAFDPALRFHSCDDFPLLWFGLFKEAEPFTPSSGGTPASWPPVWKNSVTKEEYAKAIQSIKACIVRGATYQVNYSSRLRAPFNGNPMSLFVDLVDGRNVPYAAYVETERHAVCSLSPELFFRLERNTIWSRPMKGTMPRGLLNDDDKAMARNLYLSEKNRAENIMIVDMVRNDLSRIAETSTVKAVSVFNVEKYDTVWQMTSTVQAQTSASLAQIFQALFPPASVTGAPKAQTTRIIAELETSPRCIYTGSIGFLAPGRTAQFNVAIRTILVDKLRGQAEYGVGGGIVWDSVDSAEYEECRDKAKILTPCPASFSLLETMLWTPEDGVFLLNLHLERLKSSAEYFCFPYNERGVVGKISAEAAGLPKRAHRVRLLLARSGQVSCHAARFDPAPEENQARFCLARRPVFPNNPFLYHKTTNRGFYEQALDSCSGYDEALLWNQDGELTEFCTGNLVAEVNGELITPPVRCGLLSGTYRRWLLEQGTVKERVIRIEMLSGCRKVFLCNSVRKMREMKADMNGFSLKPI